VVGSDDRSIADRLRHVDGIVDVTTDQSCTSCHGDEDPAPPFDLAQNTETAAPGVGAHRTHLDGTPRSRPLACTECHQVPERLLDPGHVDSSGPSEVTLSGVAVSFGEGAVYENGRCSNTSCHGAIFPEGRASGGTNVAPEWTRVNGTEAACGSCHALPPPAPHPRGDLNPTCSACHENIEPDNVTFNRPELHVDGTVTFVLER
jgi:predicted CxxxxCH...CXXCH cytochrome family protein